MAERSQTHLSDPLPASVQEASLGSQLSAVSPTGRRGFESSETSPCKVSITHTLGTLLLSLC